MNEKKYPNPAVCMTRLICGELWECLVENSRHCPHQMNYGAEYYCLHGKASVYAWIGTGTNRRARS